MPASQVQVFGKDSLGRNQPVGITEPVAASQTLTFSGNAVAGETFTVGGQVYAWVTTLTVGIPFQVKVGADATNSIINATAAINHSTSGQDSLYTAATPANLFVTAVATSTTVLTVTAIQTGTAGNTVASTETMTNAGWGSTTLTGGTAGALKVDAAVTATTAATATAAKPTYVEGTSNPVSQDLSGNQRVVSVGAPSLVTAQVTSTGTAATLVMARATRRSVLFTNIETDASKIAYIGPATVTTSNGFPLGPGQSVPFTWVGLLQVIDDTTNHCVIAIADEYG